MLKEIIKKDDIIALKLVSGEEVIAKVVINDEATLTVQKPLTLIHTPKGLAMSQYILMQDMTLPVQIAKEKIIVTTKANIMASEQYTTTLSSIKKPTPAEKSSIITN
jgi:hypothetical protein